MIRPVTCVCALLAAGAGLYLYQVKHRTLLLDAHIADVLRQADVARARTAVLKTEYAMLNQTDRLADLSGRYLSLHPLAPTQFVQLAGLDRHLPPIEQFPKPGEAPDPIPGTTGTDADADPRFDTLTDLPIAMVAPARTLPAKPAARAYAQSATPPAYAQATPASAHSAPPHGTAARVSPGPAARYAANDRPRAMALAAPHPVVSRVLSTAYRPAMAGAATQITPYAGSALGEAGGSVLAPPVPVAN